MSKNWASEILRGIKKNFENQEKEQIRKIIKKAKNYKKPKETEWDPADLENCENWKITNYLRFKKGSKSRKLAYRESLKWRCFIDIPNCLKEARKQAKITDFYPKLKKTEKTTDEEIKIIYVKPAIDYIYID